MSWGPASMATCASGAGNHLHPAWPVVFPASQYDILEERIRCRLWVTLTGVTTTTPKAEGLAMQAQCRRNVKRGNQNTRSRFGNYAFEATGNAGNVGDILGMFDAGFVEFTDDPTNPKKVSVRPVRGVSWPEAHAAWKTWTALAPNTSLPPQG